MACSRRLALALPQDRPLPPPTDRTMMVLGGGQVSGHDLARSCGSELSVLSPGCFAVSGGEPTDCPAALAAQAGNGPVRALGFVIDRRSRFLCQPPLEDMSQMSSRRPPERWGIPAPVSRTRLHILRLGCVPQSLVFAEDFVSRAVKPLLPLLKSDTTPSIIGLAGFGGDEYL